MYNFLKHIFNKKSYIPCAAAKSTLEVTDGIIEYCRFGRGDPLILVTGYGASMNGWDLRFLNELAKTYEVIIFSNRNTGGSKFIPKEYTIKCLADDIESLRSGLNLAVISLVGISMGGAIAQKYASLYPENLKLLTLINTFPPGNLGVPPNADVVSVFKNISKNKLLNYLRFGKLLVPSIWYFFIIAIFHFRTRGSKNIVPQSTLHEQALVINEWHTHANPKSILDDINARTLILAGEADRLVPCINSIVLNKNIKNSKLVSFSPGSHLMIFQYPKALAREIVLEISFVGKSY
ncbi:MAG: alpha/beta hydrolase fold protein [Burkholderiales bacterium]|jgi:pimeloyl-ACP methyl ester carboxylesterase|nr:alpha/beta hydrolase fold protein [Burkholderiales bacterium]